MPLRVPPRPAAPFAQRPDPHGHLHVGHGSAHALQLRPPAPRPRIPPPGPDGEERGERSRPSRPVPPRSGGQGWRAPGPGSPRRECGGNFPGRRAGVSGRVCPAQPRGSLSSIQTALFRLKQVCPGQRHPQRKRRRLRALPQILFCSSKPAQVLPNESNAASPVKGAALKALTRDENCKHSTLI